MKTHHVSNNHHSEVVIGLLYPGIFKHHISLVLYLKTESSIVHEIYDNGNINFRKIVHILTFENRGICDNVFKN